MTLRRVTTWAHVSTASHVEWQLFWKAKIIVTEMIVLLMNMTGLRDGSKVSSRYIHDSAFCNFDRNIL